MDMQLRRIRHVSAIRQRMRKLRRCLGLALIAGACCQAAQAEPVYSKARRFRIPFQFDAAELQRLGAKEVQLFVSTDEGARWHRNEAVSPDTSRFTFEAAQDGLYWFSVKTIAANGVEYPPGQHQPGLQVMVDTTAPVLELELEEVEPGRIRLAWDASDSNLDLGSLKLEFTEPDSSFWQPVAVRSDSRGQTSWTTSRGGMIQARGVISDLAGNEIEASVEASVSAMSDESSSELDFSRPVANAPSSFSGVAANMPAVATPSSPRPSTATPQLTSTPTSSQTPLLHPVAPAEPAEPKIEPQIAPKIESHAAAPEPIPMAEPPMEQPAAPTGTGGHVVNTKTFRVAYEIEDVGPSGVGSVELYITEDGGAKWFHYGNDPDRSSPVEVAVPGDGDYGFAFRVANGLGTVNQPPQPGEKPEITVRVDCTAPTARLSPVQPASGGTPEQVLIEWNVQDRQLADRPIALYYATQPNGPWEVIQTWQPNTERLVWKVPSTIDQQLYVRMDVRDAAGNVARVDAPKPYLVDRSRPKARVTEVQSVRTGQR